MDGIGTEGHKFFERPRAKTLQKFAYDHQFTMQKSWRFVDAGTYDDKADMMLIAFGKDCVELQGVKNLNLGTMQRTLADCSTFIE